MSNIIKNSTGCKINICGDNNIVIIGDNCRINSSSGIYIGTPDSPCSNCKVVLGNNILSNGFMIRCAENHTQVSIGDSCMFASDVQIWASDTHCIFDNEGKLCNIGKHITIGNHVWIGMNATILKNTYIPDNSIVGFGAIVSGSKFKDVGSVIVGNPAKVVKTGMNWSEMRPQQWLDRLQNTNPTAQKS